MQKAGRGGATGYRHPLRSLPPGPKADERTEAERGNRIATPFPFFVKAKNEKGQQATDTHLVLCLPGPQQGSLWQSRAEARPRQGLTRPAGERATGHRQLLYMNCIWVRTQKAKEAEGGARRGNRQPTPSSFTAPGEVVSYP